MKRILLPLIGALILTLSIYTTSIIPTSTLNASRLENIHGIPFPQRGGHTVIQETLAHADIYLNQPVFAKKLEIAIEFLPTNIKSLAVGIRENDFWLSYPKYEIAIPPKSTTSPEAVVTSTITIPLTDKFQEPNQSLDLMFFAEGKNPQWELLKITSTVKYTRPTFTDFKDYAKAILRRERAQ